MLKTVYMILYLWFVISFVWSALNAWWTYKALGAFDDMRKFFAYLGYEYLNALAFLPAFIIDIFLRGFLGIQFYERLTIKLLVDKESHYFRLWRKLSAVFQVLIMVLVGIVSVLDLVMGPLF